MKTNEYKGYTAKIEFDDEDQIFVGEVIGIDDIIAFHSENEKEIIPVFHDMIDNYLEACKERNITPQKSFFGKYSSNRTDLSKNRKSILRRKLQNRNYK